MVLIPDYYRGTFMEPWKPEAPDFIKEKTNWANLKNDWENKVRPYAQKHGARKFAAIGIVVPNIFFE